MSKTRGVIFNIIIFLNKLKIKITVDWFSILTQDLSLNLKTNSVK